MEPFLVTAVSMSTAAIAADWAVKGLAQDDTKPSNSQTPQETTTVDTGVSEAVSKAQAATSLHRRRVLARAAAALFAGFICSLIYFGLGDTAVKLWGVVAESPAGTLRSPAKIVDLCLRVKAAAAGQLLPVVMLLMVVYLTLQTLCIPGTIALNCVCGALLGQVVAVPLCVAAGTIGASLCFGVSSLVGNTIAEFADAKLMKGAGIPKLRAQVTKYRQDLLAYLLFLRLTPLLPNWLINLASPVVNVPLRLFVLATLLGITPQTYLSVRFGALAADLAASSTKSIGSIVSVWDTAAIAGLGALAVFVARLRKRFAAQPTAAE